MGRPYGGIIAARDHAAAVDQQAAIGKSFKRISLSKRIARRMKQGRAQQFALWRGIHWPGTSLAAAPTVLAGESCSPRARCTAKNTRSGVAGLSSNTGPV